MKISLARNRGRPLDRAVATNCLVLNLFATPGLGSWIAGRTRPAVGQMILSFSGFFVILGWFAQLFWRYVQAASSDLQAHFQFTRLGQTGVGLFAVAWVWSLFTTISVMQEARQNPTPIPQPPPPLNPPQPPIIGPK